MSAITVVVAAISFGECMGSTYIVRSRDNTAAANSLIESRVAESARIGAPENLRRAQGSDLPAENTREMSYAFRRLGKTCVWVNYMYGA